MNPQITDMFSISRGAIFTRVLWIHGKGLMILLLIITLSTIPIFLISGDYRCLILGLMFIFVVIPMFMALFYINHVLKPLTVFNSLPHRIRFTENGVDLIANSEYLDDNDEKRVRRIERHIPYPEFNGFIMGLNEVIFRIGKKGKEGLLFITPEAAGSKDEFSRLINDFITQIENNRH